MGYTSCPTLPEQQFAMHKNDRVKLLAKPALKTNAIDVSSGENLGLG